jgi:pSer/pThr/pTyr-binding forkhead associated (FHA) protein
VLVDLVSLRVNEKTVSRIHAELIVTIDGEGEDSYKLSVIDKSKFGTFVNEKKIETNVAVELKHQDKVIFGTGPISFQIIRQPLRICCSAISRREKQELQTIVRDIGKSIIFYNLLLMIANW